ncbi:ankyrin repeat-containing domain protein [Emericellopsis atlantica]|uniref:Ankyrin repeat-containing domain protein n=1 Tax=Emericellopsis atlantica TaxID=2614577 RepID=A0A9P8CLS3_9HYPO|nr:ankyrin repeat-containing domain protein [Emericellopsis atlantica]KAG9251954.1 ankyrin repeat-containing domain protein [Emericellopsis atlantica]
MGGLEAENKDPEDFYNPRFLDCIIINEESIRSLVALADDTPPLMVFATWKEKLCFGHSGGAFVRLLDSRAHLAQHMNTNEDYDGKVLVKLKMADIRSAWFFRQNRYDGWEGLPSGEGDVKPHIVIQAAPPSACMMSTVFLSALHKTLGSNNFADPGDILSRYACIRDDNLIQLEHLLTASQDVASLLNTVVEPSFDQENAGGWGTPLQFAIWMGNLDAVRMLLDAGADSTLATRVALLEDHGNKEPLMVAIEGGHRSVVHILWRLAGPPPPEDTEERRELIGHAGIVQDLLTWRDWGQYVNRQILDVGVKLWRLHAVDEILRLVSYDQDDLNMALHHAVNPREEYDGEIYPKITPAEYVNQQVLIEHLIDAGADPNFCRDGYAPLVIQAAGAGSAFSGALRVLLEKGSDPNTADRDGNTALHILTRGTRSVNPTPIHSRLTAIRFLLTHGADACLANNAGVTALQLAAQNAPDPYDFNYLLHKCVSSGRTVDAFVTESNESLLHFAALGGKRETMEMLISSYNMDIDKKTHTGWTPLMYALLPKHHAHNSRGTGTLHQSIRAARFLISHGADPLITTDEGWTPLHALSLHFDRDEDGSAKALALDLINRGAPVNPPQHALPPLQKDHAISKSYRKSLDGWRKSPLLHWAAQHGAVDVVKALLERGADVTQEDKYGYTAVELVSESHFVREPSLRGSEQWGEMGSVGKRMMEILDEAGR